MEDVPHRNHRSVTVLTYSRVITAFTLMGIGHHRVGEATKITPTDVLGPGKSFLPLHPTTAVGILAAKISPVLVDSAPGRPTIATWAMARAVVVGSDTAHKTTPKPTHEVSN